MPPENEPQSEPQAPSEGSALSTPLAIVLAGILIAGAVFFSNGGSAPVTKAKTGAENAAAGAGFSTALLPIRAVDEATDHIRGNPNAPLVIVEYSDTECPFCKRFHDTMKQVLDAYGKKGSVAWVYRYFPLSQLHPKAPKEAEALECAAALGGNAKFWDYTDSVFTLTPSNNGLDPALLPQIAEDIGIDRAGFETCLASGKFKARVQSDYNEAIGASGSGTPYNILLTARPISKETEQWLRDKNNEMLRGFPPGTPDIIAIGSDRRKVAISGAFPYSLMRDIVELLLK